MHLATPDDRLEQSPVRRHSHDQRRRILFPFVGERIGGSHRSALLLLRGLDRTRYEPVVVVHEEGPLSAHLTELGVGYRLVRLPRYVGAEAGPLQLLHSLATTLPRLFRFLRQERIDIVHSHDARMHLTWALPTRLAGCRFVWHQRTKFPDWRLARLMARLAQRIVCLSDYGAGTLPEGLRTKVAIAANPFETDGPESDSKAARARLLGELGAPEDSFIVGFVANVTAQKRPLIFVEAAAEIAAHSRRPCHFIVLGDDREGLASEMQARAEAGGIGDRLHFLGFRQPIEPWIAACDLLLATGVNEGFGRTLVEAMLAGTPVIAANSGGHREIITNGTTGWLVPPDDPAAMARAALAVLADAATTHEVVAAAAVEAQQRYSLDAHVERIVALYDDILPESRPGADIVVVIADLGSGGAQRVATTLANAWARSGSRVCVITNAGEDTDFFTLDSAVERRVMGGLGAATSLPAGALANLRRATALRRAVRALRPRVVVSFILPTNVLTIFATIGLPCRVVVSERNDPTRQFLGRHWNILRRLLYPRADVVTANSRGAIETMKAYIPVEKLAFLPNPLTSERGTGSAGKPEKAGPVILAVGRLHEQKGYDILLRAFERFICGSEGWRLWIAGDGPLREALSNQAEDLGIAGDVDWLGRVPNPFVYYQAADIFALSSRFEGTPNALLEAMSCGLPAVVTDASPGPLEHIEDGVTGLVVPAGNIEAFALALERLAGDTPLRRRLGAAARARVEALGLDRVLPIWNQVVDLPTSGELASGT